MFLELNSNGLYQNLGKGKESCCLVFPSSTKREIRHFKVVVVKRWLRHLQKSVMHVLFCRSRCRRLHRCLSSFLSGQKLLPGRLFQFRSFYLTILFCTVCNWLKISGHFLEQPSIKPRNSSVFYELKAWRHEEQTWRQIFPRLEIPWILANGLSSTEQYLRVSDLFCENARSTTDFEEKMGGLSTGY